MTSPEITQLRVGIDHFHGTRQHPDGSETYYLASRILPRQNGRAVLQIDEVLERLLPGERHQITPETLSNLGWRCLKGDKVRGDFMDKDRWIQSVIARACGAVIATGPTQPGTNGKDQLPVRQLEDIADENGRLVPVYSRNGVLVSSPNSQIYVPINPEFLPGDVSRAQFTRRQLLY